jgi:hypothetical protein
MRTPTILRWAGVCGLTLLLLGCNRPAAGSTAYPLAWIDSPLHQSSHPVAPMDLVLHAADPAGVAEIEVSVNGQVLDTIAPDDPSAPLSTIHVAWNPTAPGEYELTARAQDHSGTWGPAATSNVVLTGPEARTEIQPPVISPTAPPEPTWTPTPACLDKAAFVSDVTIPDNTNITPGQAFTKTWRLRNDGTCPWNENYQLVFADGDSMSNPTPLPIAGTVAPGSTVDLSVDLVAPSANGTYKGNYQIRNPQGIHFGVGASGLTPFYVQIVVGRPQATATASLRQLPDTQPPSVSVSHAPAGTSIPTGKAITFTANASDNVGVTRIDLWVTAPGQFPVKVKTCNNKDSCSYTGGPYNTQGNLSYFAIAADAAGHETNSGATTITLYVVISGLPGRGGV